MSDAMQEFENALSWSLNDGMATYSGDNNLPVMFWDFSDDLDEQGRPRIRISGHPRKADLSGAEQRAAVDAWADHLGLGPGDVNSYGTYRRGGSLRRRAVVELWGVVDAEMWKKAGQ